MYRMRNEYGEHFVTCGEMKLLERRADEDGLSYYQMMENAGTQAAKMIRAYSLPNRPKRCSWALPMGMRFFGTLPTR